jgi:pyruvate formate lyase activating enzyme
MQSEVKGLVHSTESFGTVDGPGIRFVIFLQGCPMRCLYCHNPDTWEMGAGKEMSVRDIIDEYRKNRAFYTNGGITVTGGEPLIQLDFVTALFKEAKDYGIHTAIDTSGITYNESPEYLARLDELMRYTDLVLLDVKHIDNEQHKMLTGHGNEKIIAFAKYIDKKGIPIWARHVVVEGYTDQEDEHYRLGLFLGTLKSLKALDVLAYHTMGVKKYEELGIPYPLDGVKPTSQEKKNAARAKILEGIRDARKNK